MSDSLQPMDCSQASLSVGFPRQEYWSGLPFPPLGIFPTQGSNSILLPSPASVGRFFTTWEALFDSWEYKITGVLTLRFQMSLSFPSFPGVFFRTASLVVENSGLQQSVAWDPLSTSSRGRHHAFVSQFQEDLGQAHSTGLGHMSAKTNH